MKEYTTTYGTSYSESEKVKGIDISYTLDEKFYTARLSVSDPVEIGMLVTNTVPPSAYQIRLLGVSE